MNNRTLNVKRKTANVKTQETRFFPFCVSRITYLGFTLVELLVIVSILAVIAVLISPMLYTGLKEGRDSKRREDLKQYKVALENYATANRSVYPVAEGTVANVSPCGTLSNFISSCPEGYLYEYLYTSDGAQYILWTQLERSGKFWALCSNGKSGELSSVNLSDCDNTL